MPLALRHHLLCPAVRRDHISRGTHSTLHALRSENSTFRNREATAACQNYVHIMSKHTPNPQDFGWKPTGANEQSKVAFYEKEGVKMDYYPSTGTVKTSMDHPAQGHTQMFRRDLSNDEFQSVLQNPRTHTGQGYQTKSSKYYKH